MISMDDFENYCNQLINFDWYYEYSDDHSVWKAGNNKYKELVKKATTHPIYRKAFNLANSDQRNNREDFKIQLNELKAELLITA